MKGTVNHITEIVILTDYIIVASKHDLNSCPITSIKCKYKQYLLMLISLLSTCQEEPSLTIKQKFELLQQIYTANVNLLTTKFDNSFPIGSGCPNAFCLSGGTF